MTTLIFDDEAIQALADTSHPKHRAVLAHLQGSVSRRQRRRPVELVVPTAVRAEAGWDRTHPTAAGLNRFRINDRPLDTAATDVAARIIRDRVVGSVADAHLGAVARGLDDEIVVLTSDPADITAVCAPRRVRTVTI